MRIALRALLAFALAGVPAAAGGPVGSAPETVELRFEPDLERPVRKVWTSSGRRELERLQVRTDGVTSEPEDLAMVLTGSKRLVVLDRYVRVGGGRPLELVRTYEELDAKRKLATVSAGEEDTVFATDACAIEGRSVRFRWDGGAYERAPDDVRERDEHAGTDDLAGLAADLDLLALLPPGPVARVAPGDAWPVRFEAFRDVLRPGGRLACTTEPREGEGQRELAERLWSSLTGEVVARYAGAGEAPDTARIELEGTYGGEGALPGPDAQRMETRMRFEGTVVWDLALGRARSLSLTTAGTVASEEELRVEDDGEARSFRRELRFREESRLSATFE